MGNHSSGPRTRGLTIRLRLALAFGALILLLVAMAAVGAWRLADLNRATAEMASVNLRMERVVGEWLSETRSNSVRAVVLTQTDDPDLQRILAPTMEATTKRINGLQKQVEALLDDPEAKRLFAQMSERRKTYLDARAKVHERKAQGDKAGATSLMENTMVPAIDAYVASIKALADFYTNEVAEDAATANASAIAGRNLLVAFCVLGVLLAALGSWRITRSITRPVDQAVATARRVADGDLTVQIASRRADEMGQLLQALGDMTEKLRALIAEVAEGARAVAESSAQIAQGNLDLSQRTEEQASTLEETASSMEELTSTVSQNADTARQANELALNASSVAREGGQAVGNVVRTMDGISASSRKIAEIIGVIDGIAFQTNILALNAAVEAARAGEQGRGFAVVASEVRNLAQRSAQAAKEIKTLIVDSVEQVEAGTREVGDAGRKMEEIVLSVRRVGDLIAEIAAASQEQSSGIEQVNTAITQMDQGVQQNASLVEEAAAATESMKAQAASLLQLVSRFDLGAGASTPMFTATSKAVAPASPVPAQIRVRTAPNPVPLQGGLLIPAAGTAAPKGGEWTEF